MVPFFNVSIFLWQAANRNSTESIQHYYLSLSIIVNFILVAILIFVIVSFIKVRKKAFDLLNDNETLRKENLKLSAILASVNNPEDLSEIEESEGSADILTLLEDSTGNVDYLNEFHAVNISHVWVEGNYVNLKYIDQVRYILVRDRLKNIYNHWQKYHFIQSHKSFLVNMKMIRQVNWNEVSLSDGSKVPLSRSHKKEFQDAYALFLKKNQGVESI
jgi:hypothetical protein